MKIKNKKKRKEKKEEREDEGKVLRFSLGDMTFQSQGLCFAFQAVVDKSLDL